MPVFSAVGLGDNLSILHAAGHVSVFVIGIRIGGCGLVVEQGAPTRPIDQPPISCLATTV
jgi:hypothetical protein